MIETATVCTGIGSPEVAIEELEAEGFIQKSTIKFACEINEPARRSYLTHFKPQQVFTDMTAESWIGGGYYSDLFIGGIPCQSFSLAGKRLGELDKRGLLFYDFHRYVKNQQPKVFIIENVKGLLSDNDGKTFQNWLLLLGNSVNGNMQMFNHPDSLGYNLHHIVLNSKDFGVPQNRERVFIVGIRPDLPNTFRFPAGEILKVRLRDILEKTVAEKYYLSDKMINYLHTRKANFNNGKVNYKTEDDVASCLNASSKSIDISDNIIVEKINPPLLDDAVIINDNNGIIEQRGIATCLDANYFKGMDNHAQRSFVMEANNDVPPMLNEHRGHVDKEPRFIENGIVPTLRAESHGHETKVVLNSRIRRLTPLECWRLQGFPDEYFYQAAAVNSDTQLYKQAGNSMTTKVMKAIIKNLLPILEPYQGFI